MKTNLNITGRVELSRQEISQAIIEYLEKHHNYKSEKVVYECEDYGAGHTIVNAVVEIKGAATNVAQKIHDYHIEQPKTKTQASGYARVNIGVFDTIRSLLNEEFVKRGRKNPTDISFDSLFDDVVGLHPSMTPEKLKIYLCDKRQFPGGNMVWSGRTYTITMRDVINFVPGQYKKNGKRQ